MDTIERRLKSLQGILSRAGKVIIAFSGGADSTFLLKIAKETLGRKNVLAVTASSKTYPTSELKEAKLLARLIGVKHIIIKTQELGNPKFSRNPPARCYYCKKELFSRLKSIAKGNGIKHILDASNYDDRKDYRPGSRAARQIGVISPLKEARLTKVMIRRLSRQMGLPTWDKPAYACLASRIPYGDKIAVRKLKMIELAENFLRDELKLKQVRVRHHGDIARVEILPQDFPKLLRNRLRAVNRLQKLGFKYVTFDLKGYRTGSMNEAIRWAKK